MEINSTFFCSFGQNMTESDPISSYFRFFQYFGQNITKSYPTSRYFPFFNYIFYKSCHCNLQQGDPIISYFLKIFCFIESWLIDPDKQIEHNPTSSYFRFCHQLGSDMYSVTLPQVLFQFLSSVRVTPVWRNHILSYFPISALS